MHSLWSLCPFRVGLSQTGRLVRTQALLKPQPSAGRSPIQTCKQKGCTMKRKRQQDGYIFKTRGIWYLRYFDTRVIQGHTKRVRIAKQIAKAREEINGVITTITKAKARELAKPTLAKVNQSHYAPETAVSLTDFVE